MKSNERIRKLKIISLLFVLPLVTISVLSQQGCSKSSKSAEAGIEIAPPPPPPPPAQETAATGEPYQEVDIMPVFKGGEKELLNFIMKNVQYPEAAKKKGIQGKVLVRFAVEADGTVDMISVLQGVDPELDNEALRVVRSLPPFEKPGIKDGKPVAVWFIIPINFALN